LSSGAPQPWTRAQFIAASSASIDANQRRSTRLLKWFFGATLINFAALGLGALAIGHFDKPLLTGVILAVAGLYILFIILFAIYIVATGGSYARRHRVACHACAAGILLQVPQFADGRMRFERIENLRPDRFPLNCAGCGARIADA
jgi:hypothetical protein